MNSNIKKHILSLSYGKDSLACLDVIIKNNLPLDEIVHADVIAYGNVSASLPEVQKFKEKADKIIFDRYGYEVKRIQGETFEERFYRKKIKGKYKGSIYGFPVLRCTGWCMKYLKKVPLENYYGKGNVIYLGIAADEAERVQKENNIKYPLIEYGWTEQDCLEWCAKNDLLSPIYKSSFRDGCWFCPKQGINQLRDIRKKYPNYWAKMLEWDKKSPVKFRGEKSVKDYDFRFELEELGLIPKDRTFRWEMLNQYKRMKI